MRAQSGRTGMNLSTILGQITGTYYKIRGGSETDLGTLAVHRTRQINAHVMLGSIMLNTFQRYRAVPMPVYKALVRPQVS